MLSSSPSKIHEPLVIGVSPRLTDRRRRQELRNTSEEVAAHFPARPLPRPPAPSTGRRTRSAGHPAARRVRELSYTGSANLLVRYLNQGRTRPSEPVRRRGGWCPGS
jgi:hypothetical protein